MAQGAGEERLPDADRAAEDHVLVLAEPGEAEQLADPGPVEGHRGLPGDLLEADELLEAGGGHPGREPVTVPAVDLVLEAQLQELQGTELALLGRGGAIR